jgi:hypothetical protein
MRDARGLASRRAVGGNLFEDLEDVIGGGLEDVVGFLDNVWSPIERNVFRPIGERLQEFERHNRETFQKIGGIAEQIAKEVGPELALAAAGVPITPGMLTGGKRPAPRPAGEASSGDGIPVWVWIAGGLTIAGVVVAVVVAA